MTTAIRSEATRSVVVVNSIDVLAIGQDGSITVINNVATPTGGQVISADRSFGVGQTWQVVTGSRASGTTYTNSTGKAIEVSVYAATTLSAIVVAGVTILSVTGGNTTAHSFTVPAGATYSVTFTGAHNWAEYR